MEDRPFFINHLFLLRQFVYVLSMPLFCIYNKFQNYSKIRKQNSETNIAPERMHIMHIIIANE